MITVSTEGTKLDRTTVNMCPQPEHNYWVPESLLPIARIAGYFLFPQQTERHRDIVRGLPSLSSFTSSGYQHIEVGGQVDACACVRVCARARVCVWVRAGVRA